MLTRRGAIGTMAAGTLAAQDLATAAIAPTGTSGAQGGRTRNIIDVHSHALLPRWLDKLQLVQGVSRAAMRIAGSTVPEWSADLHISLMDTHGIDAAVLSWPSATAFVKGQEARDLARAMNEDLASIIAKHPGRFGAFAVLPLDDMDATNEEMRYALDVLKLDGASASTHVGGVYLGDRSFDPWFSEMDRRGVPLFVHPTTPPGLQAIQLQLNPAIMEFMFDTTRMVTNMVLSGAKQKFSKIKVISTHGGGTIPYLASRISILEPQFGAGPGRPTMSGEEVLRVLSTFYFDLTASTAAASMDALLHLVDPSRLMLGFDFPMMSPDAILPAQRRFEAYDGLDASQRAQIVRGNALAMLPGLAARMRTSG